MNLSYNEIDNNIIKQYGINNLNQILDYNILNCYYTVYIQLNLKF